MEACGLTHFGRKLQSAAEQITSINEKILSLLTAQHSVVLCYVELCCAVCVCVHMCVSAFVPLCVFVCDYLCMCMVSL